MTLAKIWLPLAGSVLLAACATAPVVPAPAGAAPASTTAAPATDAGYAKAHLADYAEVDLTADLGHFDADQRRMLGLLIRAADAVNPIFWQQSWGSRASLMDQIDDDAVRRLAVINYGPWDRLNGDRIFVPGIGARPDGAQFYPADMTRAEFQAADLPDKTSLYTLLRRDGTGRLITVPYHEAYRADLRRASGFLDAAADLAHDAGFAKYLRLRAKALLDDDFRASDLAWMDMKTNPVDIVIGPIETYEDRLYGYKASYESYVLVKDLAWSERLARFAQYLPELQRELPVPAPYKAETPGGDADLNAYFAIYYAGDANTGAKTIAINLPNDEQVQLEKGTRRLQLENVMRAKFDRIMLPIGQVLIAPDQQRHITFDAFFQNTMFHEVAHGLGIKNTLDGKGTVRKALKDYASSFEEGKADVLGVYMVEKLAAKGELDADKLMDNYVTFLTGILRSVRFGASDAHAKANMVRFNDFVAAGAVVRDVDGRYRVDAAKMHAAIASLSAKILTIQGDGDYAAAKQLTDETGVVTPQLASDLKRLDGAHIPIDVTFRQGAAVLGIEVNAVRRRAPPPR